MPNNAAYSAAKAGVIGLVKAVGKELARSGVIVNAIASAMIDTAMLSSVEQWQLADMAQRIPMGRIGRAEEVAALAAWLVSPNCTFSTGAVYDVSGGRATYLYRAGRQANRASAMRSVAPLTLLPSHYLSAQEGDR